MKVLFHTREIRGHHHTIYYQFGGRAIWHTDGKKTKVISCDLSSLEDIVVLASVLLGLSLLPLREDASPPVVLNIMFMLWHVFMN